MHQENNMRLTVQAHRALREWGEEAQLWMVVEELGELLASMAKYRRVRVSIDDVVDEIADAQIMLGQLAIMIDPVAVDAAISGKIDRLRDRLDSAFERGE
jgi:NTP pyrophosphatase (non-canonical NTP hydrolase)